MSEDIETGPVTAKTVDRPTSTARFDYERYRHHLDRLDMPEAARRRLGEAVWSILHNRVERAWGDDPVQRRRQLGDRFVKAAERDSTTMLGSEHQQQFEGPANASAAREETR